MQKSDLGFPFHEEQHPSNSKFINETKNSAPKERIILVSSQKGHNDPCLKTQIFSPTEMGLSVSDHQKPPTKTTQLSFLFLKPPETVYKVLNLVPIIQRQPVTGGGLPATLVNQNLFGPVPTFEPHHLGLRHV